MDAVFQFLGQILSNLGLLFLALICVVGVFLSCLSISGTWLVVAGALLAFIFRGSAFPGYATLLLFIYFAVLVEVAEYVAGFWGVTRRGGSGWSGFAAVLGGLFGMMIGSALLWPLIGGLLGLLAGSFGLVYWVENVRLKESGRAAHIAMGAVLARLMIVLLKVCVTLGMTAWLFAGILAK
jgi:uncharacterized protein